MRLPVLLVAVAQLGCAPFFQPTVDQTRFEHALALQRSQRIDEALAVYWSLDPANRRYPGVFNNIAVIHARLGDLEQAEKMFVLASEIEQDEVVIWANLGVVRFLRQRNLLARQALERVAPAGERELVRSVTPGRTNWRYNRVRKKVQRAVAVADRYLEQIAAGRQEVRPKRGVTFALIQNLPDGAIYITNLRNMVF